MENFINRDFCINCNTDMTLEPKCIFMALCEGCGIYWICEFCWPNNEYVSKIKCKKCKIRERRTSL